MFWKTFFRGDCLKIFCEDLFFFRRIWRNKKKIGNLESTCACVLGLGLEHSCPWPRECLSSERLSLALASDFFCVLGLELCVLDSTSAQQFYLLRTISLLVIFFCNLTFFFFFLTKLGGGGGRSLAALRFASETPK